MKKIYLVFFIYFLFPLIGWSQDIDFKFSAFWNPDLITPEEYNFKAYEIDLYWKNFGLFSKNISDYKVLPETKPRIVDGSGIYTFNSEGEISLYGVKYYLVGSNDTMLGSPSMPIRADLFIGYARGTNEVDVVQKKFSSSALLEEITFKTNAYTQMYLIGVVISDRYLSMGAGARYDDNQLNITKNSAVMDIQLNRRKLILELYLGFNFTL